MANISYIRLLQAVELFSKEHMQVKRFASDFPAQMPNFGTESEKYPILFVSPTDAIFNENVTTFTIDIYCFDIIQKDRSNINTILSDCNLILSDLHRWFLDGEIFGLDIRQEVATVPIDNALLDYAAGWRMTATFDVDTYGICEIPFINEPVILMEINDVVYTTTLTCDTLADCETFTDAIDNLQLQIDNIELIPGPTGPTGANGANGANGATGPTGATGTSFLEPLFIDSYLGTRLKPIGTTYNGFTYTKNINQSIGMNIVNPNTGNGAIAQISVGSSTGSNTGMSITTFSSGYFVPYLRSQSALFSFETMNIVASNGSAIDMRTGTSFGNETSKFRISNGGTVSIGVTPSLDNTTTDILSRKSDGTIVRVDKSSLTSNLVPYTGATAAVDLGIYSITANGGIFSNWDGGQFSINSQSNPPTIDFNDNRVYDENNVSVALSAGVAGGVSYAYSNATNGNQTSVNIKNDFLVECRTDIDAPIVGNLTVTPTAVSTNKKMVAVEGFESEFSTGVLYAGTSYVGGATRQFTLQLAGDDGDFPVTNTLEINANVEEYFRIDTSNGTASGSFTILPTMSRFLISDNDNINQITITSSSTESIKKIVTQQGFEGNYLQINTGATETSLPGKMYWNDTDGTVDLGLKGGNVTLQVGQENVVRVVNKTTTNISLLEENYQAVRITGAQGQRLKVDLAQATTDLLSAETIGLVTETIPNNQEGFITTSGLVRGINTTGSLQSETWDDGDILYLSPTVAGRITKVKPIAPNHLVIVGYVVRAHITQGSIFVKVDNGYELDELHNVAITGATAGQVLTYNGTSSIWENKTIIEDVIVNGVIDKAPTQNAVFDALDTKISIIADTTGGSIINVANTETLIYSIPIPATTFANGSWADVAFQIERLAGGATLNIRMYASTSEVSLGSQFAFFSTTATNRLTLDFVRQFKIVSNLLDPNKYPIGTGALTNNGVAAAGGTPTTVAFNPTVDMWLHITAIHTTTPANIQVIGSNLKYKK